MKKLNFKDISDFFLLKRHSTTQTTLLLLIYYFDLGQDLPPLPPPGLPVKTNKQTKQNKTSPVATIFIQKNNSYGLSWLFDALFPTGLPIGTYPLHYIAIISFFDSFTVLFLQFHNCHLLNTAFKQSCKYIFSQK